tara:strand:+ start:1403 stop:1576 length:174 start_codon:yes stop_codon:yes gene_type:complete
MRGLENRNQTLLDKYSLKAQTPEQADTAMHTLSDFLSVLLEIRNESLKNENQQNTDK